MNVPAGHPDPDRWWRHARRMAYACLIGMLTFPLLTLISSCESLSDIVWPYYIGLSSVVSVYTGGVSLASKWSGVK